MLVYQRVSKIFTSYVRLVTRVKCRSPSIVRLLLVPLAVSFLGAQRITGDFTGAAWAPKMANLVCCKHYQAGDII